jgi:hypothetical protein
MKLRYGYMECADCLKANILYPGENLTLSEHRASLGLQIKGVSNMRNWFCQTIRLQPTVEQYFLQFTLSLSSSVTDRDMQDEIWPINNHMTI